MTGPLLLNTPDGQVKCHVLLHYGLPYMEKPLFDAIEAAKEASGMDEMRMVMLWRHVLATRPCATGGLIEVGCGRGGSGLVICKARTHAGIEEEVTLVDSFRGIINSSEIDFHKDGEMNDATAMDVGRFIETNGERARVLERDFPVGAEKERTYRFAHIDVDTYISAAHSFDFLLPRMVSGGIIVMDDYGVESCPGITQAVAERLSYNEVRWIIPPTSQAIAVVL